jgi:hypothetical protein
MNRFVNPHMQHQHMVARQTQQPNMQPNMQHVQQNMQPMQQSGPVMLANGMVMLPNGSIVHPNQVNMQPMNPNMMPMQGGMQPNMQQGPMMMPNGMVMMPNGAIVHPSQVQGNMQGNMPSIQPNANRFGGNSNTAITNGLSITSTENDSIGNRYQQTGTIEMQPIQEEYIPQTFTVNVEKNIKFENNTKVVLNSYIEEIKESQLVHSDDKCTLTDCFEEAVECIIESANEEGGKLITVQNFIVSNNFFKSVAQDKFNELILVDDIKSVYKTLNIIY